MRFIPAPVVNGASRIGSSYLGAWAKCPKLWYYSYFAPFQGGHGLQSIHTAPPLRIGRQFHEALAEWYLSGCRDGEDTGEYDVDQALDKLYKVHKESLPEYDDPTEAALELPNIVTMVRAYHDAYGPRGPGRDWPQVRVAHDNLGQPIIERELVAEIAPGYLYTSRLDAVMWDHGRLRVWEHKSTTAYRVLDYKDEAHWGAQFTGEHFVLGQAAPEDPIAGVTVNIVLKERSRASKYGVAEREPGSRTPAQLERWRLSVLHTLAEIDLAVGQFENAVAHGVPVETAADQWFATQGTRTGWCRAYGRPCDFRDLCEVPAPGLEVGVLRRFRPRTLVELDQLKAR